jgi:hypothetical protein
VTPSSHNNIEYPHLTGAKPAWAEVWHLWKIIIPRRTITGRLVCGTVWRRHDGRRWIYKKFVEYTQDRGE